MNRTIAAVFTVMAALLTIPASGQAETIYGYSANDKQVFSFDSANPSTLFNVHPLTGVTNDPLEAIAFRPANNQLYALGNNGIYTLDPLTGMAARVSTSSIGYSLGGPSGASFDASADRLRVIFESSSTYRNIARACAAACAIVLTAARSRLRREGAVSILPRACQSLLQCWNPISLGMSQLMFRLHATEDGDRPS